MKAIKIYTTIVLTALFISPSMAQYTTEYYGLKGKVKEVSTNVYVTNHTTNRPVIPIGSQLHFDSIGRLTYQLENNFHHTFYRYKSNTTLPTTISTSNKVISIEYNH